LKRLICTLKDSQTKLVRREGPPLFQKVKKVNEQPTVALSLGRGRERERGWTEALA
jgi:hypothetical protein